MGSIYSRAMNVVVWLGPKTQYSEPIADAVAAFSKIFRAEFEVPEHPELPLFDYFDAKPGDDVLPFFTRMLALLSGSSAQDLSSVQEFLRAITSLISSHHWWYRVWTVQEFVLASRCYSNLGRT